MMITAGICLIPGAYTLATIIDRFARHTRLFHNSLFKNELIDSLVAIFFVVPIIWLPACAGALLWCGFKGAAQEKVKKESELRDALHRQYVKNHELTTQLEALTALPPPPELSYEERISALTAKTMENLNRQ